MRRRRKKRGIQLPPGAITCACEQHLFIFQRAIAGNTPPLTEDDNGPAQPWWP